MPGKRQKGSLRSEGGVAIIAVDVPTRALFKKQAGSMPLSHYLRALALAVDKTGGQLPLPGDERLVAPNTISSVAADMAELKASYSQIELAICALGDFLGIRLNTGINEGLKSVRRSVGGGSQPELISREGQGA